MCLAVPGKIISIDDSNTELKMAKINFGGIIKDACIQWIEDVSIGDYVIVHAGFALNKVDTTEAEETIRMLNEMSRLLEDEDAKGN
ncbi:MAG: HypC/HybG/HupF family hydrogenase formation chaperone [Ignavibacteriales bacterium]|nr:HypC/HybG/HupF family hydrogenase formation chaperone [Ignavibacteriales bacterium]